MTYLGGANMYWQPGYSQFYLVDSASCVKSGMDFHNKYAPDATPRHITVSSRDPQMSLDAETVRFPISIWSRHDRCNSHAGIPP